jgi:hypothetical protein
VVSEGGDGRTVSPPAGWYPDPWTPSRRRYWNGTSWTFDTTDTAAINDPAPPDASPLPPGHGLPAPVVPRPVGATVEGSAAGATATKKPNRPIKWIAAVVVGLLVGVVGIALSNRSSSTSKAPPSDSAEGTTPGSGSTPIPFPTIPSIGSLGNNDPSAAALASLIVKQDDVPASASVGIFDGGIGLNQATLDLCNGRYPSESRRTARIQNVVVDDKGAIILSTEAVLYGDSAGTTQAFSELRAVTAACPSTPVPGGLGEPPLTTNFGPAPDTSWAQTPTVNRLAFDFTSDDGTRQPRHSIAVYLQRGRVLLGVYFSQPDGPQSAVEGQTTVEGIVGVFAARVAALPTSVVGT